VEELSADVGQYLSLGQEKSQQQEGLLAAVREKGAELMVE
jgi:hypothetical protein